ncbi:MAG TPA: ATP-binding protein [Oscillospiraceae bacterium]|uniref:ATP-binding protein n=1 Tax=Ruminococcus bromii TaxID=40518 RepID=UPI003F812E7F|nr:ATP-binding protein [Oscillospiraceae bacterium]
MGYSNSVYKAASDILHERRLNAEKAAERRKEEVYERFPRVKELEKQISMGGIKTARAVLAGGDVKKAVSKLRDQDLAMQAEVKRILTDNGYPANYFEPKYFCKKCEDKGYYDINGKTVRCSCMKSALVTCACAELNRYAPLSLSTFESFDLEYYDKSINPKVKTSPYEHMSKVFRLCQNYADNFSKNSESILMSGETGLGKTHLSLAIANEVIKKGYGVVYASAPPIISKLEKEYFSSDKDDSLFSMLADCDLLIIDDLGTEFYSQFAVSQFYNLFNSRMLSNKPIIINTNLTITELKEKYTDRFVSRICGNARQLDFLGRDIRIRRK